MYIYYVTSWTNTSNMEARVLAAVVHCSLPAVLVSGPEHGAQIVDTVYVVVNPIRTLHIFLWLVLHEACVTQTACLPLGDHAGPAFAQGQDREAPAQDGA